MDRHHSPSLEHVALIKAHDCQLPLFCCGHVGVVTKVKAPSGEPFVGLLRGMLRLCSQGSKQRTVPVKGAFDSPRCPTPHGGGDFL